MINRIKALAEAFGAADAARVRSEAEAAAKGTNLNQLAAAVLMVEAAKMDGKFDDAEVETIFCLIRERFSLSEDEAQGLLADAKTASEETNHLLRFTRAIKDGFPLEERVDIIEMLWEVAYADGELHPFEANLVRRVTGLLYVRDQDSGRARKRVLDRLGIDG
jgi:uncharacterized tellurite resistance protein B-like protein